MPMKHGMKVWERVLNERLKQVTNVCENQFGFRVRKSSTGECDSCRRSILSATGEVSS